LPTSASKEACPYIPLSQESDGRYLGHLANPSSEAETASQTG
jgi:hypothetical protein